MKSEIKQKLFSIFKVIFIYFSLFMLSQSCDRRSGSFLTELAFENIIIVNSGSISHRGVSAYDVNGTLIKTITDFRTTGGAPRGSVFLGNKKLLIAQDTPDKIDHVNFDGDKSTFHGSNYYSGSVYGLAKDSRGNIYSTETSSIAKFNSEGIRQPSTIGPEFIEGTIGVCTINNARKIIMTDDDILIVASYTSGEILTYDVSTDTPACLSAVSVGAGVTGLVLHSNGSLYFNSWIDDSIYRANMDGSGATVVWSADTSIINNPTAMVELPDGSILIASYSTHTIERIDEDGNRIGSQPFISDGQTLSVYDLLFIGEDEE